MSKWINKDLPDLVFFQEGPGIRNTQYTDIGVKLLNVANLQEGKLVLDNTGRYISKEEAYGRYKHFLVDEGDLIIGSSGIKVEYFEDKMGFANKEHLPLCMNTSTIRFKTLDDKKLDIRFFMYFLKSILFKKQIAKLITGSAQLNFGPSHLKKIKVTVTEIEIQKKIVNVLDKTQSLIDKRNQQLEDLDKLIKSIFYQMFGDPISNTKGWKKENAEKHIDIISGYAFKSEQYSDNEDDIKICGGLIIYNDYIDWSKAIRWNRNNVDNLEKYFLKENDIVLALDRPWISDGLKIAVIKKEDLPALLIQRTACLRSIDIDQCFLYQHLQDRSFNLHCNVTETTVPHISTKDITTYPLIIPPMELQREFADIVKQVENQKATIKHSLSELKQNFNSLMQRAFKGELY
ncbi:restriction endonuclease subunit S [Clostridium oryzae]|uniref:Type-1 restriction enzyme EcoKI specificity protein n=1 Tax=Clostridium oryzae TaxID=1450648 RepID=A0A1V4II90_9CLOT|nr:restriction endonuclease subunit S [Clostridium oryzae]OPJ59646.1 type-1 restriction enzyme EcoKI specificity protein [Clostridium oryzae]